MSNVRKPCVFCGEMPAMKTVNRGDRTAIYRLMCMNKDCVVEPATKWADDKPTATKWWNKRVVRVI